MTMISTYKNGKGTPIIVDYAVTSGLTKDNVMNVTSSSDVKDRNRYPYYVDLIYKWEIYKRSYEGITLRELARKLQGGLLVCQH